MNPIVPFSQTGGVIPAVDIGNGETITADEFFGAIVQHAPLALQHQQWLYLAKMAFLENRADALMLAKQQAQQIQRGIEPVGNGQMGTPYQPQAFPTTYCHPPQAQPIVIQPHITVNPTISPTISPTATSSPTVSPNLSNQTETTQKTPAYYYGEEWTVFQWLGALFGSMAVILAIVIAL